MIRSTRPERPVCFYTREEVETLVRAAASEQDGAVFLTAAMTGLRRGELVALRWRDVDFAGRAIRVRANYSHRELVTPKSGKVRSVPMVPEVAQVLARLGQRELFSGDADPVFIGHAGGHPDASALRRRYASAATRAGLRRLPFHSLRHYFGSMAVNRASLVQVQSWIGHAHIQTTARYRFLGGVLAEIATTLDLHLDEDPTDAADRALRDHDGPLLVFCRHAGPADSFLIVYLLLDRYGRLPHIVMKRMLALDPCIDLVTNRLPNALLDTSDPAVCEAQIAA